MLPEARSISGYQKLEEEGKVLSQSLQESAALGGLRTRSPWNCENTFLLSQATNF